MSSHHPSERKESFNSKQQTILIVPSAATASASDDNDRPMTIIRRSTSATPKRPLPTSSRFFIFLIIFESLILVLEAITAVVVVYRDDESRSPDERQLSSAVLNTALVAITTTAGFLFFALDAIRLQHRFQLFASFFTHSLILVYVIVHWRSADLGHWFGSVSLFTMIFVMTCELIYFILSYWILQSFGRRMFDRLRNARPEMVAMYQTSEVYFSLLKIDFFLQLLLVFHVAFFVSKPNLVPLSLGALGLTFICLFVGFRGVHRESSLLMKIFVGLSSLQLLNDVWSAHEVYTDSGAYPQYTFEEYLATTLIAFFVRVALLVWSYWVTINFTKGLKERLWQPTTAASATSGQTRPVIRVIATNEMATVPSSSPIDTAAAHDRLRHSPDSTPMSQITMSVTNTYQPPSMFPESIDHNDSIVGASSLTTVTSSSIGRVQPLPSAPILRQPINNRTNNTWNVMDDEEEEDEPIRSPANDREEEDEMNDPHQDQRATQLKQHLLED